MVLLPLPPFPTNPSRFPASIVLLSLTETSLEPVTLLGSSTLVLTEETPGFEFIAERVAVEATMLLTWPESVGAAAKRGLNAELAQRGDQCRVDAFVQRTSVGNKTVFTGQHEAVGQFNVVQNRSAAAYPADYRTIAAGRMAAAIVDRLKVSQRQRRLVPTIESPAATAAAGGPLQQHLVDRHVPRPGPRRIE